MRVRRLLPPLLLVLVLPQLASPAMAGTDTTITAPPRSPTPATPATPPARWVTDHAGFLTPAVSHELDARLGDFDQRTGHQVLVYIDHTTGGVPIEDWAVKAFERWRVGRAGIDDGAVLFIFSDDHKLRIEVGYGLEDRVPDIVASRIINERMVPRIRSGDNDGAVRAGVDALLAAIGSPPGKGVPPEPAAEPISGVKLVIGILVLLLLLGFAITHPRLAWLMLLSIGSGRGGGGGGGWGGGGGGGGGGFSGGGGRSGGGGASGSW